MTAGGFCVSACGNRRGILQRRIYALKPIQLPHPEPLGAVRARAASAKYCHYPESATAPRAQKAAIFARKRTASAGDAKSWIGLHGVYDRSRMAGWTSGM